MIIEGSATETIQNKSENKRQKQASKEKGHVGRYNSHFTNNSSMEPKCCFCKETGENIATNGPKGMKIVWYFACQKFVEMAPKDRFKELKNTGYCFQCLFPGASLDKEKHHHGMCQRDFLCKHKSHDNYPIKKGHRSDTENQELLQKHKDRFIMKQPDQLTSFSRDLKLSFHMNQNQPPNYKEMPDQEKAIYTPGNKVRVA